MHPGLYCGSKSQYGSSFDILFPSQHFQLHLPRVSSVLTIELYAILFTLKKLFSYPFSSFVFFRLKILSPFYALYTTHHLVRQIQEWLFCLYVCKKSVCLCWVLSHAGITGNERVDSLVQLMIVSIHFAPFYLAVGNPSGLTSQIINYVQYVRFSLVRPRPQE